MKQKLISIVLILVFMVQILPVKEVASLLTSGQMTEDIHDIGAKKPNPNEEVHKKLFFYASLLPSDDAGLHQKKNQYVPSDQALINNLLQEVLIQPPDIS
ncbi:hypothetical protein [Arachidicoccus rhizosphaerae]|uniref:hypothetical protein n=1 Tax=Arachidicoccus rhizosphaerae TaxID=551991 RepID=UPI0011133646|nr:hypothetical protein [Arachidicoccus rhizosphaerae]